MQNLPWSDIIWIVLVLFFVGASAIGNWVKKMAEQRQAARRRDELARRGVSAGQPGADARAVSLEEMASRRREELRALAQQRPATGAPGRMPSPGDAEPANLTMAERIARARAKEQYRQRAETLRTRQQDENPAAARRHVEEQARQRELAKRQRDERARQMHQEAHAQREREMQRRRAQSEAEARARADAKARQHRTESRRQVQQTRARPVVAPSVPPTAEAAFPAAAAATRSRHSISLSPMSSAKPAVVALAALRGVSLRDAIIVKEILDRPVSLREAGGPAF